jgi:hypothetical protein
MSGKTCVYDAEGWAYDNAGNRIAFLRPGREQPTVDPETQRQMDDVLRRMGELRYQMMHPTPTAQELHDRRPLGGGLRSTCRSARDGSGLPKGGLIPAGFGDALVRKTDEMARAEERKERLLAFNGGDVNLTLCQACREGGLKDARFLLSCGAAIDCKDKSGMRPLLYAASHGQTELVHMLLNAGATKQGLALLNAASGGTPGHTAVAKQLLCYEKKLKRCHGGGSVLDYALFLAAREGHLEMATLLLDAGADVDVFQSPDDDPEFGGDPIFAAKVSGHTAMVELLRSRGADAK